MSQNTANSSPEATVDGPLLQLTYVSGATIPFSTDDLAELVSRAREQNEAMNITGCLLYREGSFMQVIEGPCVAVDQLFQKILQDPRHARILVLRRLELQDREFSHRPLDFLQIAPETCVGAPFSSATRQRLFRDFCDGKWLRAFDCHRKENGSVPICNPFFGAMWAAAEPMDQEDQTNIQVVTSQSQTAQNSGDMR